MGMQETMHFVSGMNQGLFSNLTRLQLLVAVFELTSAYSSLNAHPTTVLFLGCSQSAFPLIIVAGRSIAGRLSFTQITATFSFGISSCRISAASSTCLTLNG